MRRLGHRQSLASQVASVPMRHIRTYLLLLGYPLLFPHYLPQVVEESIIDLQNHALIGMLE